MQGNKQNPRNNAEGYPDPTAYTALKPIIKDEHELDKAVHHLVKTLKFIVESAGFELIGRVQIRHKKTRKEYR